MLSKVKIMKDIFILCIVLTLFSSIPSLLAEESNVLLYEKSNYGGQHIRITTSVADLSQSPYYFNDILSSVKLVGISSIAVYENADYTGWCETITSNVNNFGNLDIDHDTVSSIKLNAACITGPAVILYEKDNFGGKKIKIFGSPNDLGDENHNFDDKTSSFKLVGGASSVALFEQKHFTGNCQAFTSDQRKLKDTTVGNDTVTSVKVNGQCDTSMPHVMLYEDENYRGKQLMRTTDAPDLRNSNFNDKISSLKLVEVPWIAAYEDPDFKGNCHTFTTNAPSMAGTKVGNDKISSIRFNAKCENYVHLIIKNRSATIMAYSFPSGNPISDRKTLAAAQTDDLSLQPNSTVEIVIQVANPNPTAYHGVDWEEKCRYTFNMNQEVIITFKGTLFKSWCENSLIQ